MSGKSSKVRSSDLVRRLREREPEREREGRQRRKILTEEEYTGNLSKIITRDYYPSLPSLHRDAAVLQKRSEGDIAGAVAIRRAARKIANEEEYQQRREMKEEEMAREIGIGMRGVRKRPRPLDRESVDGFHARVTSEDNAEFEMNMKKEARQKRMEMDIVYNSTGVDYKNVKKNLLLQNGIIDGDNTNNTTTMKKEMRLLAESPLMASDEFTAPVQRIQVAGTTREGGNICDRNSLFFSPPAYTKHGITRNSCDGGDDDDGDRRLNQDQVLMLENDDGNKHEENIAMPPPSTNPLVRTQSSLPVTVSKARDAKVASNQSQSIQVRSNNMEFSQVMQLVEYQAKPPPEANEKRIIPSNTRFEFQRESRIVPSSSSNSQTMEDLCATHSAPGDNGKLPLSLAQDTDYSTAASTDLDASPLPLSMERRARMRKIEKERNTFVAMTPLIVPGGGGRDGTGEGEGDDSPIITWGKVSSTPLVVSGGEQTSEPLFSLPGEDKKKSIARKAEAMVAKRTRQFREAGQVLTGDDDNDSKRRKSTTCTAERNVNAISSRRKSSRSTHDRIQSLTPAAQLLLERSTPSMSGGRLLSSHNSSSKPSVRSGSSFGSALRSSYTPKTRRDRSQSSRSHACASSSRRQSDVYKSTPLVSRKYGNTLVHVGNKSSSRDCNLMKKDASATGGLLKM